MVMVRDSGSILDRGDTIMVMVRDIGSIWERGALRLGLSLRLGFGVCKVRFRLMISIKV